MVMAESTRDDYIAQQLARGNFDHEQQQSWSVLNTAKFFYVVSVD
jgi:hypothetical protein